MSDITLSINGRPVVCDSNDTVMNACEKAGVYIPHLCHHQGLTPHGSCRLCIVEINGRVRAACTTPASAHTSVLTETPDIQHMRLRLVQLLFTEGNHFCPTCELSGNCQLQAMAYHVGMLDSHFAHAFPARALDASHPTLIIDRDRCINCALCVRASHQRDHKNVFQLTGRGPTTTVTATSDSGLLGDTDLAEHDHAAHICPTGALLLREKPYAHAIGQRLYDNVDISLCGNQRPETLDATGTTEDGHA